MLVLCPVPCSSAHACTQSMHTTIHSPVREGEDDALQVFQMVQPLLTSLKDLPEDNLTLLPPELLQGPAPQQPLLGNATRPSLPPHAAAASPNGSSAAAPTIGRQSLQSGRSMSIRANGRTHWTGAAPRGLSTRREQRHCDIACTIFAEGACLAAGM